MSIFWLGGKPDQPPFPETELSAEMFKDRYFKPGVIHGGEDYLIRVYLNDSHAECPEYDDHNQFEVEYISRDLIKEAALLDPTLGEGFDETIFEGLESFGVPSTHGDFAALVEDWPKAVQMSNQDLLAWANSI